MDLIKINENKLKIMLTSVDMQSYSLCADELDCTNIETREAFRSIMNEARSRTGFDAEGNQIYVQLYPSKEGGCELFVTKLGLLCPQRKASDHTRQKAYTPQSKENTFAFSFEKLAHLLCVCRRLRANEKRLASAVFHGEDGCYYLILSLLSDDRQETLLEDSIKAFIHEYATKKDTATIRLYIKEHATVVCEQRAIETLAKL